MPECQINGHIGLKSWGICPWKSTKCWSNSLTMNARMQIFSWLIVLRIYELFLNFWANLNFLVRFWLADGLRKFLIFLMLIDLDIIIYILLVVVCGKLSHRVFGKMVLLFQLGRILVVIWHRNHLLDLELILVFVFTHFCSIYKIFLFSLYFYVNRIILNIVNVDQILCVLKKN